MDKMLQQRRFGTVGIELLEAKYRELYWYCNELQITVGEDCDCIPEYENARSVMDKIIDTLGYTPSA